MRISMKIRWAMLALAALVLLINARSGGSPASAQSQSNVIHSVSIFNSPAVPDVGAHSIIGVRPASSN